MKVLKVIAVPNRRITFGILSITNSPRVRILGVTKTGISKRQPFKFRRVYGVDAAETAIRRWAEGMPY